MRYIITDFGTSSRYDLNDVSPHKQSLIGAGRALPQPCHDAYKADIYHVGDLIRTGFMEASLLLLLTSFPYPRS